VEEHGRDHLARYKCSVNYELEAYASNGGPRHIQHLTVNSLCDPSQLKAKKVEKTGAVRLFGLFPRGKVWMRVHLNKDVYR